MNLDFFPENTLGHGPKKRRIRVKDTGSDRQVKGNSKHINNSLRIKLCEIFNRNTKSDIFLFILIKTEDWAQMIIMKNLKIVKSRDSGNGLPS